MLQSMSQSMSSQQQVSSWAPLWLPSPPPPTYHMSPTQVGLYWQQARMLVATVPQQQHRVVDAAVAIFGWNTVAFMLPLYFILLKTTTRSCWIKTALWVSPFLLPTSTPHVSTTRGQTVYILSYIVTCSVSHPHFPLSSVSHPHFPLSYVSQPSFPSHFKRELGLPSLGVFSL